LFVVILILLCFLKQTEAIYSEKFSELGSESGDAGRQDSAGGSGSGDYCRRACDANWAHIFLPLTRT
jgi:hypothetical protein